MGWENGSSETVKSVDKQEGALQGRRGAERSFRAGALSQPRWLSPHHGVSVSYKNAYLFVVMGAVELRFLESTFKHRLKEVVLASFHQATTMEPFLGHSTMFQARAFGGTSVHNKFLYSPALSYKAPHTCSQPLCVVVLHVLQVEEFTCDTVIGYPDCAISLLESISLDPSGES
jgi:hypothetical protein